MTENFYKWVGWSRENEWRADADSIFKIDDPENCQEIAEAVRKLYADGYEALAVSIAQRMVASAIPTEILLRLADHAFWNFDLWASVSDPSQAGLKRRDFYFKKLEVATKEIHKRRIAGDKAVADADWAIESHYVLAAARQDHIDDAMDMMLEVPEGKLSYRAAAVAIIKMMQLALADDGKSEGEHAVYDKVMAKMDLEKMRNLVYTIYNRTKSAKDEVDRSVASMPASLLLFWYDKQGDYIEARNFFDDSKLGADIKKHLDDNIATAGICNKITNATIGAAFFASLCIGLYSFAIHAATGTDAGSGVKLFAWHTAPAVIAGVILYYIMADRHSVSDSCRAWYLAKFWWIFVFFALPLFPIATSVVASIVFFFITLYAYPRYRGWK